MTACSLYVLASRTEAMGRVLLEAMASEKPIIASNVDGVPTVIRDGYNGLLFVSESVDDLADKMRTVLSDKQRATTLARNGLEYVMSNLSEACYLNKYQEMVRQTLKHVTR